MSCAAWQEHDLTPILGKTLTCIGIFMLLPMLTGQRLRRHGEILRELTALVEAGKLYPLLDPTRFLLEEAAAAHAHLASGKAVGKVVVDIVG